MTTPSTTVPRHWNPFLPTAIEVVQQLQHATGDDFEPVLSPLRAMTALENMAPTIGQASFPNRSTLHIKAASLLWLLAELLQKAREVSNLFCRHFDATDVCAGSIGSCGSTRPALSIACIISACTTQSASKAGSSAMPSVYKTFLDISSR